MELRGIPRLEDSESPAEEEEGGSTLVANPNGMGKTSGRRSGSRDSTVEREEGEDASSEGDGTATFRHGRREPDGRKSRWEFLCRAGLLGPGRGRCRGRSVFEQKNLNRLYYQRTGCHTAGGPAQATDLVFVDEHRGNGCEFHFFAETLNHLGAHRYSTQANRIAPQRPYGRGPVHPIVRNMRC